MRRFLMSLFIWFLLTPAAWAAFLNVQTSTQGTGTGNAINVTVSATGVNNLVVVHIKIGATTETCTSVTDNKSNAYVLSAALDDGTTFRSYQAYGVQTTSGTTTVTANFSGTGASKRVGADEYSGGATTNANVFDKTSTGSGVNGSSTSVTSFSPTNTGELIVASLFTQNNRTWTAGTNYVIYNGVNPITERSEYRLSSASSETAPSSFTGGTSDWTEIATAFIPAASTSNTSSFFLMWNQ